MSKPEPLNLRVEALRLAVASLGPMQHGGGIGGADFVLARAGVFLAFLTVQDQPGNVAKPRPE